MRRFAVRHERRLAQVALPGLGLLRQDVALEGVVALDLAGGGQLEALDGAAAALQLQLLLGLSHSSPPSALPRPTPAGARRRRGRARERRAPAGVPWAPSAPWPHS